MATKESSITNQGRDYTVSTDFLQRLRWYIRLRWIAAAAIFVVVLICGFFLQVITQPWASLAVAVFVFLFNLICLLTTRSLEKKREDRSRGRWASVLLHIQTVVDLVTIAALIHLNGGVENPFAVFFIFHVILTGFLLEEKTSMAYAVLAVALYAAVVWGEFFHLGSLQHNPIDFGYFVPAAQKLIVWDNPLYVFAASVAFTLAIFVSNYMARWAARMLHRREQQLEKAYGELTAAEQARTEYIMRLTHELRSPLATIRNCLSLTLEPPVGAAEQQQQQNQMLRRAHKRTDDLLALVNDLLDLARIQSGKCNTEAEHVDVVELINETCSFFKPRIDSQKQKMITNVQRDLGTIYASRELLTQMITNLLSNAHKYTPQGGTIEVCCHRKGQQIIIQVKDDGIGISEQELPRIFDDFFRGKNASQMSTTGTGLGMCIVRRAVEQCGGTIEVSRNVPQGTIVTLLLPIEKPKGS